MRQPWRLALSIVMMLQIVIWGLGSYAQSERFDANVSDRLVMAAYAADVETAHRELSATVQWLEANKMTEGTTDVIWKGQYNDIGRWYRRLVTLRDQLGRPIEATAISYEVDELGEPTIEVKTPATIQYTQLSLTEQSKVLGRVKEVLIRSDSTVRLPSGISAFPNNAINLAHVWTSVAMFLVGVTLFIKRLMKA